MLLPFGEGGGGQRGARGNSQVSFRAKMKR